MPFQRDGIVQQLCVHGMSKSDCLLSAEQAFKFVTQVQDYSGSVATVI